MRRARGEGERGAVAVEAAIVTPLVLAIILGILEAAFLMRDYVSVTSASRVAARIASTGAAAGACLAEPDDVVPCPPASAPKLAQMAADEISQTATALPKDSIRYMLVFKANDAGFPGTLTSMPDVTGCVSQCVAYRWSPAQSRFRYVQGSWDSRTISACASPVRGPLDSVGVQIVVDHDYSTGLLGESIEISDRAVTKFEPLSNSSCASGEHL